MKSKMLAIAVIISLLSCGSVTAQWPQNTYGNQGRWEVEVGARLLDRPTTDIQFSLVTVNPTNVTVFDAGDAADLDVSAGAEIRFSKNTSSDSGWEIRGTVNRWDNFESRTGDLSSPLFTPAILPIGTDLTNFDYGYESNLFSLELNYKRTVRPGVTFMIGPRYVDLTERIEVDTQFNNPMIPGFLLDIDTVTEADNRMPGLGFGVDLRRPISRDLFFVGTVRGAILANFTSTTTTAETTLAGLPPALATVFTDRQTDLAGIGEVSGRFHYDIAPGTVSVYTGYEAQWLDGVALAPAQLFAAGTNPVLTTSNTSFAHGLVFGMMVRF